MCRIIPVDDLLELGVTLVQTIMTLGENAPFGVGTICNAIKGLIEVIQQHIDVQVVCVRLLRDIQALCPILTKITVHLDSDLSQSLQNLANSVENITIAIKQRPSNWFWKMITTKGFQGRLDGMIFEFQMSKNTLTLAVATHIQDVVKNPLHLIPGSDPAKWSACSPVRDMQNMGDNRCMIMRPDGRCDKIFPKYVLITHTNGHQVMYHVCGKCAQNSKNAWWKTHYTRVDRTN